MLGVFCFALGIVLVARVLLTMPCAIWHLSGKGSKDCHDWASAADANG